jgi:hypothetical protein
MLNKTLYHDWQKARRASFIPAGAWTLPRFGDTALAFIRSATQTHFIAGPLWVSMNRSVNDL